MEIRVLTHFPYLYTMRIDIITLLPELLESPFSASIVQRAQEHQKVHIHLHDLREYGETKYRQVDDYPYGGGPGMILMVGPIDRCIQDLKAERTYDEVIYMTPDGARLDQKMANDCSLLNNIIILCGHYKGVDHRVRDHLITKEISIGDFVLSGGELAAAVFCDSIIRLIPGVLGDESSALSDTFQDNLISPPIYTRPAEYKGWKVPDILTSGNTPAIEDWRMEKAMERTQKLRPDLLE